MFNSLKREIPKQNYSIWTDANEILVFCHVVFVPLLNFGAGIEVKRDIPGTRTCLKAVTPQATSSQIRRLFNCTNKGMPTRNIFVMYTQMHLVLLLHYCIFPYVRTLRKQVHPLNRDASVEEANTSIESFPRNNIPRPQRLCRFTMISKYHVQ